MCFARNSRMVDGGHMTYPPASVTYASIVSRHSLKISFVVSALNGLNIITDDIGSLYLNAPCREKIYFTDGAGFGNQKVASVVVVHAIYELKYIGYAWISHCVETMRDIYFSPSKADPDVWM